MATTTTTTTITKPSFHIPTIDISPYLQFPTSPASQSIITQIRSACTTTGFFQLTGHSIPPSLQKAVITGSTAFFALPFPSKNKLDRSSVGGAANRGYEVIGTQGLQADTQLPDLREGFYIGEDIPSDHALSKEHPAFCGPNIWPDEELLPEEIFKRPMMEYYERMFALALVVLEILARGMEAEFGADVFGRCGFVEGRPVASIRLLHYPPQTTEAVDGEGRIVQLGSGAHTDFGGITLLLQDEHSGLQVLNEGNGDWVDVKPNSDAYVVNVGDMLGKWTRGKYKSAVHRVLNDGGADRYSVPFFFDGNMKCRLDPFDGGPLGEGEPRTVEDHMLERFKSTYGRGVQKGTGMGRGDT